MSSRCPFRSCQRKVEKSLSVPSRDVPFFLGRLERGFGSCLSGCLGFSRWRHQGTLLLCANTKPITGLLHGANAASMGAGKLLFCKNLMNPPPTLRTVLWPKLLSIWILFMRQTLAAQGGRTRSGCPKNSSRRHHPFAPTPLQGAPHYYE